MPVATTLRPFSILHPEGAENLVLKRLPEEEWRQFEHGLKEITVAPGERIQAAGGPLERIVFPCEGVFSVRKRRAGEEVEVALIGRDGLIGVEALLNERTADYDAVAVFRVRGWQIDGARFAHLLQQRPRLRSCFDRFVGSFVGKLGDNVIAAKRSLLAERLAGWLVSVADLTDSDDLAITQDGIASSLGVRRSGVTQALAEFEGRHLLAARRGRILLHDRAALAKIAGSSNAAAAS
jgi:CRP-like cAMP-binding protein